MTFNVAYNFSYCIAYYKDDKNNETLRGAMVCFEGQPITASLWTCLKLSLITISVAFLILTLYIYWIIPDLRQTEVSCRTKNKVTAPP